MEVGKLKLGIVLPLAVGILAFNCSADTIITDFQFLNPLSFAYGGTTWATPVKQFESFTSGSVFGQEVVPIAGGNPTVSGGAGTGGLNYDLSGDDGLELTARLLPGDQATQIQVLLFDSDGTIVRFAYPIGDFNTSSFNSGTASFSSATTIAVGSIPGFNLSHITTYEVQGDFFDPAGAGTALFQAQFDDLTATGAPEPSPAILAAAGLFFIMLAHSLNIYLKSPARGKGGVSVLDE